MTGTSTASPATRTQKATRIIERMRAALLKEHAGRKPGLTILILGIHPVEPDAYVLATGEGRMALSLNPAGQLIVRPRSGPRLFAAITARIGHDASWDERQQGWRIHEDRSIDALASLLSINPDFEDVVRPHRHPASPQKPMPIAVHSAFGIATGEIVGDVATLRILDARLRALLSRNAPCGTYEDGRSVGTWRFASSELDDVRIWIDRLR